MEREGLVVHRKLGDSRSAPSSPTTSADGHWRRTTSGASTTKASSGSATARYCYPLTLTDQHSRLILAARAWPRSDEEARDVVRARSSRSRPAAAHALRQRRAVRVDGLAGLTQLSAYWLRWASRSSGSALRTPRRTAATSGCTARSSPRRRGRRALISSSSRSASMSSSKSSTPSVLTRRSA